MRWWTHRANALLSPKSLCHTIMFQVNASNIAISSESSFQCLRSLFQGDLVVTQIFHTRNWHAGGCTIARSSPFFCSHMIQNFDRTRWSPRLISTRLRFFTSSLIRFVWTCQVARWTWISRRVTFQHPRLFDGRLLSLNCDSIQKWGLAARPGIWQWDNLFPRPPFFFISSLSYWKAVDDAYESILYSSSDHCALRFIHSSRYMRAVSFCRRQCSEMWDLFWGCAFPFSFVRNTSWQRILWVLSSSHCLDCQLHLHPNSYFAHRMISTSSFFVYFSC